MMGEEEEQARLGIRTIFIIIICFSVIVLFNFELWRRRKNHLAREKKQ